MKHEYAEILHAIADVLKCRGKHLFASGMCWSNKEDAEVAVKAFKAPLKGE